MKKFFSLISSVSFLFLIINNAFINQNKVNDMEFNNFGKISFNKIKNKVFLLKIKNKISELERKNIELKKSENSEMKKIAIAIELDLQECGKVINDHLLEKLWTKLIFIEKKIDKCFDVLKCLKLKTQLINSLRRINCIISKFFFHNYQIKLQLRKIKNDICQQLKKIVIYLPYTNEILHDNIIDFIASKTNLEILFTDSEFEKGFVQELDLWNKLYDLVLWSINYDRVILVMSLENNNDESNNYDQKIDIVDQYFNFDEEADYYEDSYIFYENIDYAFEIDMNEIMFSNEDDSFSSNVKTNSYLVTKNQQKCLKSKKNKMTKKFMQKSFWNKYKIRKQKHFSSSKKLKKANYFKTWMDKKNKLSYSKFYNISFVCSYEYEGMV